MEDTTETARTTGKLVSKRKQRIPKGKPGPNEERTQTQGLATFLAASLNHTGPGDQTHTK